MVSVPAFYSDDPSSNPAGYLINFLYEKTKINEKEAGVGPLKKTLRAFILPKLCDGEVRGVGRLQALVAGDADPDIGFLDHGHVVGAVADGQADVARVRLDLSGASKNFFLNLCLLTLIHHKLPG